MLLQIIYVTGTGKSNNPVPFPLWLALEPAFIPLSRGVDFVLLGDYILLDSILR